MRMSGFGRRLAARFVLGFIALASTGVAPVLAEDFFRKIPSMATIIGPLAAPVRVVVPPGLPLSIVLPRGAPSPELFKAPSSTANARVGIDPFTGRSISAP